MTTSQRSSQERSAPAPDAAPFAGRVAIVTGGSKGIGYAIADELAAGGADIAICARGEAALTEAAQRLERHGRRVLALTADVTSPADITAFVDAVTAGFGRIDILVNNAVTSVQDAFEGLDDEAWRYHIEVKLLGYVRFCRAVVPRMAERGFGRIVNIAGMSARIVTDFRMTNGAVNSAVTNFSKHLSEQVARKGITVNTVHPGLTWTPRLETVLVRWAALEGTSVEVQHQKRSAEIPIGRFIQPAELAHLVAFLCGDRSGALTGQSIAVDGGSGRGIPY
jgi:NAD(P)-dependent dehydrogenase (short-subunit alcohol dehydrogenase family)